MNSYRRMRLTAGCAAEAKAITNGRARDNRGSEFLGLADRCLASGVVLIFGEVSCSSSGDLARVAEWHTRRT